MTAGKPLIAAAPEMCAGPPANASYNDAEAAIEAIAGRMTPTRRRLDIMSALATGHLPWGVPWPSGLTREGNRWVLCCGHVLDRTEAQQFVSAGLLIESRLLGGDPGPLKITDAGRSWLARHW